jgi:hypothetical protein
MANLISVGCKLPQGLVIEVGYEVTNGGTNLVKQPSYARIVLKGANQHSIILSPGVRSPSPTDLQPGLTHNVDEAVFDEWARTHKQFVPSLVFKATKPKEAAAIAKEMTKEKTGLEAADPTKARGITKADFNSDADTSQSE